MLTLTWIWCDLCRFKCSFIFGTYSWIIHWNDFLFCYFGFLYQEIHYATIGSLLPIFHIYHLSFNPFKLLISISFCLLSSILSSMSFAVFLAGSFSFVILPILLSFFFFLIYVFVLFYFPSWGLPAHISFLSNISGLLPWAFHLCFMLFSYKGKCIIKFPFIFIFKFLFLEKLQVQYKVLYFLTHGV